MGASTCKACGIGSNPGTEFSNAPPPKAEADGYKLDGQTNAGLDGFDPMEAGDPRKGASSLSPGKGPAGALDLSKQGAGVGMNADTAPGNTSESYWTSYFTREDKELRELASKNLGDALVPSRRRHTFRSDAVYDGEWLGNERSGFGIQTWPDGAVYEGQWKQSKAWGHGRFRHCDGDVYIGQWRQNMAHGLGKYLHRDGTTYEGDFLDDLQDGTGIERWPDKSEFRGEFTKGKKNGKGIYTWPDKSRYEGQWKSNHIDGFGSYIGADARRFDGCWRSSSIHGCGKYSWPDQRTYAGQYVMDQKDGFGTFTWANGRRYEGFWHKGCMHGIGRYCQEGEAGVEMRIGEWSMGERTHWLDEDAAAPPAGAPALQDDNNK
mmetsp:Transcript_10989/g.24201  ORF Transcript_10989/g.24201 Transcript_10989/m.24201 type:complete len:377 (-) Transcript_10989:89-1219(-)|eukprot:CAMPEP_0206478702 /NCGR_PEP_ID=MMETSP0324_2-20121206/36227_1 /ASSEMBLY_ACC=CAM_ASM_000836 /TAXON_ID=2866 /ORGANISM="Crypthecodinium cohnii, Strain Seligo" /LENGTH=376 /DNA_ID=CAMNT_0053955091 /DNA_START=126 /DNA_END=1256 /DNA_ORIENTATION=+